MAYLCTLTPLNDYIYYIILYIDFSTGSVSLDVYPDPYFFFFYYEAFDFFSLLLGDPAGARNKPGSGYGYGLGIRVDSPLGPLRLEYAFNDKKEKRFHFGVGYRN